VRFSLQRFDFGSFIFRDAWEAYKAAIPPAEHGDFIAAYYKRLTSDDPTVRAKAAAVRSRLRRRSKCAQFRQAGRSRSVAGVDELGDENVAPSAAAAENCDGCARARYSATSTANV
jgi:hypothetical protein